MCKQNTMSCLRNAENHFISVNLPQVWECEFCFEVFDSGAQTPQFICLHVMSNVICLGVGNSDLSLTRICLLAQARDLRMSYVTSAKTVPLTFFSDRLPFETFKFRVVCSIHLISLRIRRRVASSIDPIWWDQVSFVSWKKCSGQMTWHSSLSQMDSEWLRNKKKSISHSPHMRCSIRCFSMGIFASFGSAWKK